MPTTTDTMTRQRRTYGFGAVGTVDGVVVDDECPMCYVVGEYNLTAYTDGWYWMRVCDDCDYSEHGKYTRRNMAEQTDESRALYGY